MTAEQSTEQSRAGQGRAGQGRAGHSRTAQHSTYRTEERVLFLASIQGDFRDGKRVY